jgi:hypothetical protein
MAKTSGGVRGSSSSGIAIQNRILKGNDSSTFKAEGKNAAGDAIYKDENGYVLTISKRGSNSYATLKNDKGSEILKSNAPIKGVNDTKEKVSEFTKKYNLSGVDSKSFNKIDPKVGSKIFSDASSIGRSIQK